MIHFPHKNWVRGVAWLTRLPVTEKIEGSNPFGPATSFANDVARHSNGEPCQLANDRTKIPCRGIFVC